MKNVSNNVLKGLLMGSAPTVETAEIQFLLTVYSDGSVGVDRIPEPVPVPANPAPTPQDTALGVGDSLDLHCKVMPQNHARLVRITVEDDAIPRFTSIEEAEAWMESRKDFTVAQR